MQGLSENVKKFETKLGVFESSFSTMAPGLSMPSTSGSASTFPSYPRLSDLSKAPSTSVNLPVSAPLTTQSSCQDVSFPPSTTNHNHTTAIPVQVSGRCFIPPAAVTVSPKIRSDIIQGKDIDLAALLLPPTANHQQMLDCVDVVVFLKTSDSILHPDRREELDLYLALMVDFYQRYGGTLF